MANKARSRIRQGDIAKALRAAKAAGFAVSGFEVDENGKLSVQVANESRVEHGADPFDRWKANRDARPA
jgi:hypothetical protein